jgi:hypothetical protein
MIEPKVSSSSDIPEVFLFDEQRLHAAETQEKQELYLLQWLAQVEREIKMTPVVKHRNTLTLLVVVNLHHPIGHLKTSPTYS